MSDSSNISTIAIFGERVQTGTYVLHVGLEQRRPLVFGRFRQGRPLVLPAGQYLYVGSAMGNAGSTTLARRLLRHASRSGEAGPHPIRKWMPDCFFHAGLSGKRLAPPRRKKCHWHVDYLLEDPGSNLAHVLVLRTKKRLERALAAYLQRAPYTSAIAPGLGASDAVPGHSHLLRLDAPLLWTEWARSMGCWFEQQGMR